MYLKSQLSTTKTVWNKKKNYLFQKVKKFEKKKNLQFENETLKIKIENLKKIIQEKNDEIFALKKEQVVHDDDDEEEVFTKMLSQSFS